MTEPWHPHADSAQAADASNQHQPWMPPQAPAQQSQQTQPAQQATPWMPPQVPSGSPVPPTAPAQEQASGGATTPQQGAGPQPRTVPGLGFVNFLLGVGAILFAAVVVREWVVDWGTAIGDCVDGASGSWGCVVSDQSRNQVLIPILAIFAAFSLARGSSVENRQGRSIGWLYALLGFGVLVLAWSLGASG